MMPHFGLFRNQKGFLSGMDPQVDVNGKLMPRPDSAIPRACPESLGCFSSFDAAASKPSDLRCRAQQPSQEVRATLPGAAVRM